MLQLFRKALEDMQIVEYWLILSHSYNTLRIVFSIHVSVSYSKGSFFPPTSFSKIVAFHTHWQISSDSILQPIISPRKVYQIVWSMEYHLHLLIFWWHQLLSLTQDLQAIFHHRFFTPDSLSSRFFNQLQLEHRLELLEHLLEWDGDATVVYCSVSAASRNQ